MRLSSIASGLVAALGLCALTSAAAASHSITSCKTYASSAAEEWADGRIRPASDVETGLADEIVLISYGRKYIVPRQQNTLRLKPLGQLAKERNEVYEAELHHCLYGHYHWSYHHHGFHDHAQ